MPNSFAETQDGVLLVADGFGPVLAWDGFSAQAQKAGTPAPAAALTLSAGATPGGIVGTYRAYSRFVGRDGLVGDLSPVSNELVVQTRTGNVTGASSTSPIVITSANHGLTSGVRVKLTGVTGQTGANGVWDIMVLDPNRFHLINSRHAGAYKGAGAWTAGSHFVTYTNVPSTDDPRVTRRQILRNTDGQFRTFYVDIDTADLITATIHSPRIDSQLVTQPAVPVLDAAGNDLANVHAEPPVTKAFLVHHQNRMFYLGTVEYAEGAVAVAFGSKTVTGVGTEWTEAAAQMWLSVIGGDRAYEVESVDVANQTLTLVDAYAGRNDPYAAYALRPAAAEEQSVQYSEANLPQSVPALNAFALAEDGDKITGGLSKNSYLYILKRRHVYRYTFQSQPEDDGAVFLAAHRGCVNHRCLVLVEDAAYMLDEDGVHVFDQGHSNDASISTPVQTLFRRSGPGPHINWSASRYFSAVHDPSTETIRFFVALSGQYLPRHALCYHYTLGRWDVEEYAVPVGSCALGTLARQASLGTWGSGRPQVFLGSQHRRVLALGTGPLDGCDHLANPSDGPVAAAGRLSLTAGGGVFQADAVGCPLAITRGRGKGQVRLVTAVSGSTLTVKTPWLVLPDATSHYQLGAIKWEWKSGWFRWVDDEQHNSRRVELMFEPAEGDRRLTLRRYRDRTDVPVPAAVTRADDGVRTEAGSGDVEVGLNRPSGFAQMRLDGSKEHYAHGPRLVAVGLSGFGGPAPVRIYQVTLDGVRSE